MSNLNEHRDVDFTLFGSKYSDIYVTMLIQKIFVINFAGQYLLRELDLVFITLLCVNNANFSWIILQVLYWYFYLYEDLQ